MARYTVVQHSGFGYAHKPGFAKAVETRKVGTLAKQRQILRAGGLIFDTYKAADDYCEQANYPPGVEGIYPQVIGSFLELSVDDLRVYKPDLVLPHGALTLEALNA